MVYEFILPSIGASVPFVAYAIKKEKEALRAIKEFENGYKSKENLSLYDLRVLNDAVDCLPNGVTKRVSNKKQDIKMRIGAGIAAYELAKFDVNKLVKNSFTKV